jgi:hypothetical protein
VLLADVSERSIGSIFIGRWMKNGWGSDSELVEPIGRGVVVIGGWMEHGRYGGGRYIIACQWDWKEFFT